MPDTLSPSVFTFQGGFATDLAPQVRTLSFLQAAENLIYEVSGAVRKVGGAAKVNSSALSGDGSITGMFDYWRTGTTGAFTQKFVVMFGREVWKEDMDGTFDDITGAAVITADAIPVWCVARDLLTIWTDKNDTPLKWNQTGNVASLGGTPPAGRGMVFHANRGWVWGVNANPSRLYYSSSTDIEDWSGMDTGSIDIEPDDGDRIIGAVSYKQSIVVFKGPNKGSIHVISGTSVSTFARTVLVRGIPLQTHNSIVEFGDDVAFMSDMGIHSLAATEKFGNFSEAMLTRYLRGYFRDSLNRAQLHKVWGVNYGLKGCLLWIVPKSGSSTPDEVIGLSYIRLQEEGLKPFVWTRGGDSAAIRIHPTTKLREVVFGDTNGFVRRQDTPDRNIDTNTAYTMRVKTPFVLLGAHDSAGKPRGDQEVTLHDMWLRSKSIGNWNVSISVRRDDLAAESYTFNQGQAGFILGTSILGTGVLGSAGLQISHNGTIGGTCRSVQLDITQGGLNQDANLYELGIDWKPNAQSGEDT